jgi:hypothetical protein
LSLIEHATHKDLALRLFYLGIQDQIWSYLYFMNSSSRAYRSNAILFDSLKTIVKQYGFPTLSMVGVLASTNAFLILQHAPKIQTKYYKMVKKAHLNHDFPASAYAYLTDRWLMHRHKKQLYGSQFVRNAKSKKLYGDKFILFPVKDFEHINERRKEIGMSTTIEEHVESLWGDDYLIPETYYKKNRQKK